MITRLHVRNYRSIGAPVELELGRLTALVGPNGAGKSNLADALRFIADAMRMPLAHVLAERGGLGAVLHAGANPKSGVWLRAHVETEHGAGWWSVTLVPGSDHTDFRVAREEAAWSPVEPGAETLRFLRTPEESEAPRTWPPMLVYPASLALPAYRDQGLLIHLADELRGLAVYALFPNTLRAPQAPSPIHPMSSGGENWASTLAALGEDGRENLVAALRRLVGGIRGCDVQEVNGCLVPRFRHRGGGPQGTLPWFTAAQESDGTLRLAGILTALLQRPSPTLLGFDEPELSVPPGAMAILYRHLVEASAHGQVLLTSHSPEVLDLLAIEDVRIVLRPRGETTVAAVYAPDRNLVRQRLLSATDADE